MERIKIAEMEKENIYNTYLLLQVKEEKLTKSGKPYMYLTLTDGTTVINSKIWNLEEVNFHIKEKEIMYCQVNVKEYNGSKDYTIAPDKFRGLREDEKLSVSEFIPTAPVNLEDAYNELFETARQFTNPSLKTLVSAIYADKQSSIMRSSAAKSVHHNVIGGLLYHTLRMTRSAQSLCEVYPDINIELVTAGCMLHDIGKLVELATDDVGAAEYTVDGELFGHLLLGADIIKEYGDTLNSDPEVIRNLRHILVSHHGKPEWGAVKYPCTMEASLVHYIDLIDSTVYQFEQIYKTEEPGTLSQDRFYSLNGIRAYVPNLE